MAACDSVFSRLSLDELFDTLGAHRRSAGLCEPTPVAHLHQG
jgi:hypothetical protein